MSENYFTVYIYLLSEILNMADLQKLHVNTNASDTNHRSDVQDVRQLVLMAVIEIVIFLLITI